MSGLWLPVVWAVVLAGQLAAWRISLRPGRLDRLAPRRLVALRWTTQPDAVVVATVLGTALLIGSIALTARHETMAWPYLGIGLVLLSEALVARTMTRRLLNELGDRGQLSLPPDVERREPRRRRSGLGALTAFSIVTLFPAFEDLPTPLFLVFGAIWVAAIITLLVAGVLHAIDATRLLDARRRALQALARAGGST